MQRFHRSPRLPAPEPVVTTWLDLGPKRAPLWKRLHGIDRGRVFLAGDLFGEEALLIRDAVRDKVQVRVMEGHYYFESSWLAIQAPVYEIVITVLADRVRWYAARDDLAAKVQR